MISITNNIDELQSLGLFTEKWLETIKQKQVDNLLSGYISCGNIPNKIECDRDPTSGYFWFAVINSKKPRETRSHKNNVALLLYGKYNAVYRIWLDDKESALQWLSAYEFADLTPDDMITYSFEEVF